LVSSRTRTAGRRAATAALCLALVSAGAACSDPDEEEFTGAFQAPRANGDLSPGADPTLGADRFLAQLQERTGYEQSGFVEIAPDGSTWLWVHVDPEHEAWVAETLDGAQLDGLEVIATQPIGAGASPSPDARRYTTREIAGYRDAVADLVATLGEELAALRADDPESYPTRANITVIYGVAGDTLTVSVQANIDRLPARAVAELGELVPADVLDLILDAEE
jgi:hypothetical protein